MQGHVFRDQLRVQLGRLDLENIDVNLFAGQFAQFFLELVDLSAFTSDDDAGPGSENGDAATSGSALDQDARDRSRFKFFLENLADFMVFGEQFAEFLLFGIPLGAPVMRDGDAKTDWIGFLTHNNYSSDKTILT